MIVDGAFARFGRRVKKEVKMPGLTKKEWPGLLPWSAQPPPHAML